MDTFNSIRAQLHNSSEYINILCEEDVVNQRVLTIAVCDYLSERQRYVDFVRKYKPPRDRDLLFPSGHTELATKLFYELNVNCVSPRNAVKKCLSGWATFI